MNQKLIATFDKEIKKEKRILYLLKRKRKKECSQKCKLFLKQYLNNENDRQKTYSSDTKSDVDREQRKLRPC